MKKEMVLDRLLDNSAKRRSLNRNSSLAWIHRVLLGGVESVFYLITLTILLALPSTVLVIGKLCRDPRYCPIELRINRFLIVNGDVSLG